MLYGGPLLRLGPLQGCVLVFIAHRRQQRRHHPLKTKLAITDPKNPKTNLHRKNLHRSDIQKKMKIRSGAQKLMRLKLRQIRRQRNQILNKPVQKPVLNRKRPNIRYIRESVLRPQGCRRRYVHQHVLHRQRPRQPRNFIPIIIFFLKRKTKFKFTRQNAGKCRALVKQLAPLHEFITTLRV